MKTRTAVLITACITFIATFVFSQCYETKHSLVDHGHVNGIGDVFVIGDGTYELIKGEDGVDWLYSTYQNQVIISNHLKYVFEDEALFFCSEDGYAIVYPENNLCKVYLFPEQNSSSRIIASPEYPKNKLVVYLNSYDEYTEHEKSVLNRLMYEYYYEHEENEK